MKKENPTKNTPPEKGNKSANSKFNLTKKQKIWLGIATIVLILLIIILVFFLLNLMIFDANRHFTIHKVYIDNQGKTASYWNDPLQIENRSAELAREMQIEVNKDNLFAQDLAEKRAKLLEAHPEMEDIQLFPIYPDHLKIQIKERLPVARLPVARRPRNPDSSSTQMLEEEKTEKLIDKNGCIFSAKYFAEAKALPCIADDTYSEIFPLGGQVQGNGIKFLMQFIRMMEEKELLFQVVSARIIEDASTDNYGHCIKAHLKKDNFECKNVFFPYDKKTTIEKLKRSCLTLKEYAIEHNEVKHGNLSISEEDVTLR